MSVLNREISYIVFAADSVSANVPTIAPNQTMKPTSVKRRTRGFAAPWRSKFSLFATTPLDFIQVPGFPSAIRVFALTHSRRIAFQR